MVTCPLWVNRYSSNVFSPVERKNSNLGQCYVFEQLRSTVHEKVACLGIRSLMILNVID